MNRYNRNSKKLNELMNNVIKFTNHLCRSSHHQHSHSHNHHLHINLLQSHVATTITTPTSEVKSHEHVNNESHNIISYHKRKLPNSLIALSSPKGRLLFSEALANGTMECYFPLSEQFMTQSDPSFCSLSTLAMVLNALNHDPKRTWKGIWRWVTEETLQCESKQLCGHSHEKVKHQGMSFTEFETLAKCHAVNIESFRAVAPTAPARALIINNSNSIVTSNDSIINDDMNLGHAKNNLHYQKFLEFVRLTSTNNSLHTNKGDFFVICNFSRKSLEQTGDGHYSPIAGYHEPSGMMLVMDVARFKYPPYWVPGELLWQAMSVDDATTKQPRGYFIVSNNTD